MQIKAHLRPRRQAKDRYFRGILRHILQICIRILCFFCIFGANFVISDGRLNIPLYLMSEFPRLLALARQKAKA